MRTKLTEDQINRAYRLYYGENKTLGEIVEALQCSLYDLTPWLTAPGMAIAQNSREDVFERIRMYRTACEDAIKLVEAGGRMGERLTEIGKILHLALVNNYKLPERAEED